MHLDLSTLRYPSWVDQEHELINLCNEFFHKDRPEIVKFAYGVKRTATDQTVKHTMFIDIVVKDDGEAIGMPLHFEGETRNDLFTQLYKRFNP